MQPPARPPRPRTLYPAAARAADGLPITRPATVPHLAPAAHQHLSAHETYEHSHSESSPPDRGTEQAPCPQPERHQSGTPPAHPVAPPVRELAEPHRSHDWPTALPRGESHL